MTTVPDHIPADLHQPAEAPAYTDAEILEFARIGHDHDAAESVMNRAELAVTGVRMQRDHCHHCRATFRLRPTPGTGWAAEWFHAAACPEADR